MSSIRFFGCLSVSLLLILLTASTPLFASDFGEVGVGTQVVVVKGDTGNATGLGLDVRARFLWFLGVDYSATNLADNRDVWGTTPYRFSLLIHLVNSEYFGLHLSPGLAGANVGDSFNPVGDSTWYRLGGGLEGRYSNFALGFEAHWTMPGETQIERHIEDNGEALLAEYIEGLGSTAEIPSDLSSISTGDALDILNLDRVELTIGLRYYF